MSKVRSFGMSYFSFHELTWKNIEPTRRRTISCLYLLKYLLTTYRRDFREITISLMTKGAIVCCGQIPQYLRCLREAIRGRRWSQIVVAKDHFTKKITALGYSGHLLDKMISLPQRSNIPRIHLNNASV